MKIIEPKLSKVEMEKCVPLLRKLPTDTKEEDLFNAIEEITVPPYVHQFIQRITKPKEKKESESDN